MDIKLDGVDFEKVFQAAIIQSLDAEKQAILIKGALEFLFKKSSSYGSTSPLEQAFNGAMRQCAQEYVKEVLENELEVKQKIQTLIKEAVEKMYTDGRMITVDKICNAIIDGITKNY